MKDLCDKAWDELYGKQYGMSDKNPTEPMYSFFCSGWGEAEEKLKCCGNCRWEQPSSFCDHCKRLEGWIFADTLTSDNWEPRNEHKY